VTGRLVVIGDGLIGRSVQLAWRRQAPGAEVRALEAGDDPADLATADIVVVATPVDASAIPDGATLMMGGFGLCGIPEEPHRGAARAGHARPDRHQQQRRHDDSGIGVLLRARQVRKMISTYVGENKEFERQFLSGKLEVELVPQGTFAERIRAGAPASAAFYTPTGYGTIVAEGKETREIDGRTSCSSCRCRPTSRSSRHRATASATSCTGAPRATSTR
jgi:hypothetical protein